MSAEDDAEFDDPGTGRPSGLPGGFRAAVAAALAGLGYSVASWDCDGVNVVAPAGGGEVQPHGPNSPVPAREQYVGLSNLYRRAKAEDRSAWPVMIREFLEHIPGAVAGPKIPDDLTTVANQLR